MDKQEKEIRESIFRYVKELYELRRAEEKFVPGTSSIPYAGRVFDEKEIISLVDAALDFWLTLGRYGREFQEKFSEFLGVRHVVLTNSGSSANLLAVSALLSEKLENRLQPDDEVITVAASFPTTINPIIQNGLVPVFLDIKLGTYNIDSSKIALALTERTKAIFIAHTLGNPFNLRTVMDVANRHGLYVIEDACDALGSTYEGKPVGTFGDMATMSFYPAHHMTMGEGGAVVTNHGKLARIVESFRDWGRDCWCESGMANTCKKRFGWQLGDLPFGYDHKYIFSHIGYNLKPLDLQAAIGVEQLKKLPSFIEKRKKNFRLLYEGLKRYEDYFILPEPTPGSDPSWFGFLLTLRENNKFSKNDLVNFLEANRISTRMLFSGNITRQPAYRHVRYRIFDTLENTDYVMNHAFFIGVYPGLDEEKISYVLSKFDEFMAKHLSG